MSSISSDVARDAALDFEREALARALGSCSGSHDVFVCAYFDASGLPVVEQVTASRAHCLCALDVTGEVSDPDFALAYRAGGEWQFERGSHPDLQALAGAYIGRAFPSMA